MSTLWQAMRVVAHSPKATWVPFCSQVPTIRLHPSVPVAVPSSASSSEAIPSVSCIPQTPGDVVDRGTARGAVGARPERRDRRGRTTRRGHPGSEPVHSDFSKVPISLSPSPRTVISSPSIGRRLGTGEPGVDVLARHHRRGQVAEVDLGPVDLPRPRELVAAVAAGERRRPRRAPGRPAAPSPPAPTRRRRRSRRARHPSRSCSRIPRAHLRRRRRARGNGPQTCANASYRRR